jgi:hypothetical protein
MKRQRGERGSTALQAGDCAALADRAEVEAPLVDLLLKVYKAWFRPLALHQQKTKLREHTIRPRIFCVRLAGTASERKSYRLDVDFSLSASFAEFSAKLAPKFHGRGSRMAM